MRKTSASGRGRKNTIMNKISLCTNEAQMIYSDREKQLLGDIFQLIVHECPQYGFESKY